MEHFKLNFKGYILHQDIDNIPEEAGIYFVYRCKYISSRDTVLLKELIYIGQAIRLKERLKKHEKTNSFFSLCENGETICYSYVCLDEVKLDIVENALIYAQKPQLNDKLVSEYYHQSASFRIEGKCAKFEHLNFTIMN